jgi:hypothetical protein
MGAPRPPILRGNADLRNVLTVENAVQLIEAIVGCDIVFARSANGKLLLLKGEELAKEFRKTGSLGRSV